MWRCHGLSQRWRHRRASAHASRHTLAIDHPLPAILYVVCTVNGPVHRFLQASRSVSGATKAGYFRAQVEAALPELDPTSEAFRASELIAFAHMLALPLVEGQLGLSAARPMVKLLFSSVADATLGGSTILTTSLPISVLGDPSAIGPRDGAFVVIAPDASEASVNADAALAALLDAAGSRPVILVNPRLGGSALLQTFESAYLLRPLSVGYLRDQCAIAACTI